MIRIAEIFRQGKERAAITMPEIRDIPPRASLPEKEGSDQKYAGTSAQLYDEGLVLVKGMLDAARKGTYIFPNELIAVIRRLTHMMQQKEESILALLEEDTPKNYLYAHSLNVAILSLFLAIRTGFDDVSSTALGMAALVHDCGMLMFTSIARKNKVLSESEKKEIEEHVAMGKQMVARMEGIGTSLRKVVAEVMAHHHERSNGNGYPNHVSGDKIHPWAHILNLSDVYIAMTHKRPYREAIMPYQVLQMLIRGEGNLREAFSPRMIKVLIELLSLYPVGSFVRLNNHTTGQVIGANREHPTRPVVRILLDEEGRRWADRRKVIDLTKNPVLWIEEAVDKNAGKLSQIPGS